MHGLSRSDARRIAVGAQLLGAARPVSMLDTVTRLTVLQADPTAAVAPNADLVLWSRLGSAYQPAELVLALEHRILLDLRGMIRPAEDLALYRDEMRRAREERLPGWRGANQKWVEANDACRRDVLDRLGRSGPLPARELPDTCAVPWKSSGWNDDRNVTMLLELMVGRGEVAAAGRGPQRVGHRHDRGGWGCPTRPDLRGARPWPTVPTGTCW